MNRSRGSATVDFIPVYCERCQNVFQMQPALLGQKIRCPNPRCRNVFVVGEASPPPGTPLPPPAPPARPRKTRGPVGKMAPTPPAEEEPPAPAPRRKSDHVSDVIPFLEADAAPPADLPLETAPRSGP